MGNSAKRDQRKIATEEQARQALELRKAGASYDKIAQALGFADRSGAYYCVKNAIKQISKEPAQDVLALELERLDAMQMSYWQKSRVDPKAAALVLQIMDRRARYLGLIKDKLETLQAAEHKVEIVLTEKKAGE